MYIDLVPDEVIWTVNWLHYLNYEPISRSSSTCYLVCTGNNLGQTVTSYGWWNSIPRFFLSVDRSQNNSRLTVFLTEGKRVFRVSIFSLVCSGNGFASGRLHYGQASTYRPRPTYYITVLVFVCLFVCTALACSTTIWTRRASPNTSTRSRMRRNNPGERANP